MKYPKNVWQQLKSITADELIRALDKDDWVRDTGIGSELVYRHDDGRIVSIHYHPRKTYHRGLLKGLLDDIGWTEEDMRRLKLIK